VRARVLDYPGCCVAGPRAGAVTQLLFDHARYAECSAALVDGPYRYTLERVWDDARPPVLFVCLNPSTADASSDDQTVRRMRRFARDWGHGGLLVGNLFAYRATDPRELREVEDPIGPANEEALWGMAGRAGRVVAAWGSDWMVRGAWPPRLADQLREWATSEVVCLGHTRDGHPRHPLRLAADTPLEPLRLSV
jgi:hypothetical protein